MYHAILRRSASVKFMAVPNYTYLKLKIPGVGHKLRVLMQGRKKTDSY
jgi:hypothetical protein